MKRGQLRDDSLVVELRVGLADTGVELGQPMQHQPLELRHILACDRSPPRDGPAYRASSARCCAACDRSRRRSSGSPGRCADRPNSRRRPPTSAGCRRRSRGSRPAAAATLPLRLRHLLALLVEDEAVREHDVIGCATARAAALQQGRTGTSRDAGRSLRDTSPYRDRRRAAIDAGKTGKRLGSSSVNAWVEPESNHTSRTSVDLLIVAGLSRRPAGSARRVSSNHASAPSARKPPRCGAFTRLVAQDLRRFPCLTKP